MLFHPWIEQKLITLVESFRRFILSKIIQANWDFGFWSQSRDLHGKEQNFACISIMHTSRETASADSYQLGRKGNVNNFNRIFREVRMERSTEIQDHL
jgi:hypothetical protein